MNCLEGMLKDLKDFNFFTMPATVSYSVRKLSINFAPELQFPLSSAVHIHIQ